MTRVRANDYYDKTNAILDVAASIFAKSGYPVAKMQDIAEACGSSKSMLYHYFPTKEDLLFELIMLNVEDILNSLENIKKETIDIREKFLKYIRLWVQKPEQARQRHVVAVNGLKYLSKGRRALLAKPDRAVVELTVDILRELNPALEEPLYKPYAMMLIGMLNWSHLWYRPDGRIAPEEFCERVAKLFLDGFLTTQ